MKYLLILILGFSLNSFAQNGGVNLTVLDNPSLGPITVSVYMQRDTIEVFKGITNQRGTILLDDVPPGRQSFKFYFKGKEFGYQDFFVQDRQILSTTVLIDTQLVGINTNTYGVYEIGLGQSMNEGLHGQTKLVDANFVGSSITSKDIAHLPARMSADGVMDLQCVTIASYKTPLIQLNGSATAVVIDFDEINNMPMRDAASMATTVGGVQSSDDGIGLHVRGSRADASNYYIDGVRVRSLPQVPQTSMNQVTVYTSGIPASYGDLTGGVISVESKSYFDLYRKWKSEQLRNGYHRLYTPEVEAKTVEQEQEVAEIEPMIIEEEPKEIIEARVSADRFHPIYENMFLSPAMYPNSTFGLDVDRASWTYVQNTFARGQEIQRDAVKMEEMINAFHYRDVKVPEGELMHVEVVRSECLWSENSELLSVHMKAMDLPRDLPRKTHNFVFLIDVSGSMSSRNKLGLLKEGLKDFVKSLRGDDVVSIVTYAGHVGVALQPTSNKDSILNALGNLESGGSTNGMGGIQKAYELAEANLDLEKNNRIILCTDGDFNVGISNTNALEEYISQKRGSGIYLTALGFGMGNYRNDILESLADRGDGNHFYINSIQESRKVLMEDIGNLLNIARDVKLDVEFDSTMVNSYRLIGYENRLLQPEDFVDDTKDGGEIGYSHEVVAVYEVQRIHDSLLVDNEDRIANVRLRYKPFEAESSIERGYPVYCKDPIERGRLLNTVVGFGLLLRSSAYSNQLTAEQLYNHSLSVKPASKEDRELLDMIEKYRDMQIGL